jgi:hypothetical protein
MKETSVWAKSLYSCLLIRLNLAFSLCLRLDTWSRRTSIDHHPRKRAPCLNFSLLNKSRYGLASVSNPNPSRLKSSPDVGLYHWLLEPVIYLHYEFHGLFFIFQRELVSWPSFENTKEGYIKNLKDLSCVWRKSDGVHSCLGEKTDGIISDMTWLGQLSINNAPVSSENPSNVRNSEKLGKKSVRISSRKLFAFQSSLGFDLKTKSVPNRTPCFLSCSRTGLEGCGVII